MVAQTTAAAMDERPSRIDTLEMRIAHQDRVIDDLNASLLAQWRVLDPLVKRIAALEQRARDVQTGFDEPGGTPEPRPPHY
jgi:SlyX protein